MRWCWVAFLPITAHQLPITITLRRITPGTGTGAGRADRLS